MRAFFEFAALAAAFGGMTWLIVRAGASQLSAAGKLPRHSMILVGINAFLIGVCLVAAIASLMLDRR